MRHIREGRAKEGWYFSKEFNLPMCTHKQCHHKNPSHIMWLSLLFGFICSLSIHPLIFPSFPRLLLILLLANSVLPTPCYIFQICFSFSISPVISCILFFLSPPILPHSPCLPPTSSPVRGLCQCHLVQTGTKGKETSSCDALLSHTVI